MREKSLLVGAPTGDRDNSIPVLVLGCEKARHHCPLVVSQSNHTSGGKIPLMSFNGFDKLTTGKLSDTPRLTGAIESLDEQSIIGQDERKLRLYHVYADLRKEVLAGPLQQRLHPLPDGLRRLLPGEAYINHQPPLRLCTGEPPGRPRRTRSWNSSASASNRSRFSVPFRSSPRAGSPSRSTTRSGWKPLRCRFRGRMHRRHIQAVAVPLIGNG